MPTSQSASMSPGHAGGQGWSHGPQFPSSTPILALRLDEEAVALPTMRSPP